MKQLYFLFAVLFFFSQDASALFRHPREQRVERHAGEPTWQQAHSFQHIAASFSEQRVSPKRHVNPDDSYRSTSEGLVSIVCVLFSLVCFVAASAASFPLFLIPAFTFAVVAAVFGAVGIRRYKRGFAILGLALGLIEIVAGFAVLAQL